MVNYNDHASKSAPTVDDFVPIWDVAAGQSKKATIANIINARLTGGGIVATGGFTLTVPATGTAALRGVAQSFTATQTFAPASGNAIEINMPAGNSSEAIRFLYDGTQIGFIRARANNSNITLGARDLGNNETGPNIVLNRNTNAGAEGPSPGTVIIVQANGTSRVLWPDNSGLLRIHTAQPTGSTGTPTTGITAGVVVGDQTSMAAAKHISDDLSQLSEVLQRIERGAAAVRRFVYKSGAYNNQEFEGVVTDLAPPYGMDRDDEHPQGKSLNEIQILGDLLRAVADLSQRVAQLEG